MYRLRVVQGAPERGFFYTTCDKPSKFSWERSPPLGQLPRRRIALLRRILRATLEIRGIACPRAPSPIQAPAHLQCVGSAQDLPRRDCAAALRQGCSSPRDRRLRAYLNRVWLRTRDLCRADGPKHEPPFASD